MLRSVSRDKHRRLLLQTDNYWSSTENNPGINAWNLNFDGSNANFNNDNEDNDNLVRACLAYWVITCMRSDKPPKAALPPF